MDAPASRFVSAPDGLRLHVAEYGMRGGGKLPVVCLAGLSRNSRDFTDLATALAAKSHRVLALDYRGRGRSERDPNWRRYSLRIEQADILAVLAALDIDRAAFVGTSRGGLHIMGLAASRPALVAAAVLNDISPVVETSGLMRIKLRLSALPNPVSWAQGAEMLRQSWGTSFSSLTSADWNKVAHGTLREIKGRLRWDYDPALARTLDAIGPDTPAIDLWPQFDALSRIPILAIRGENSDILSPAVFAQMESRSPVCKGIEIPGQGHAPILADRTTIDAIGGFLADLI